MNSLGSVAGFILYVSALSVFANSGTAPPLARALALPEPSRWRRNEQQGFGASAEALVRRGCLRASPRYVTFSGVVRTPPSVAGKQVRAAAAPRHHDQKYKLTKITKNTKIPKIQNIQNMNYAICIYIYIYIYIYVYNKNDSF